MKTYRKNLKKTGFVYVSDAKDNFLQNVINRNSLRKEVKARPWIVVNHQIHTVNIANWPGSLSRVAIRSRDKSSCNPFFTRADSIEVIEEIPLSRLFGMNGNVVLQLIDLIGKVDDDTAQSLADSFDDSKNELYSQLDNINRAISRVPLRLHQHQTDSLKMSLPGCQFCTPINGGFSIIYSQLFDQAKDYGHSRALLADKFGKITIDCKWTKALANFLFAAMVVGYKEHLSDTECKALSAPWERVFGRLQLD